GHANRYLYRSTLFLMAQILLLVPWDRCLSHNSNKAKNFKAQKNLGSYASSRQTLDCLKDIRRIDLSKVFLQLECPSIFAFIFEYLVHFQSEMIEVQRVNVPNEKAIK